MPRAQLMTDGRTADRSHVTNCAASFDPVVGAVRFLENSMSGIDLAKHLKQRGFQGQVFLMTGYSAAIEDARALNLPIIFKPFSQQDLLATLKSQPR